MQPEKSSPIDNGPQREIIIKFDGFLADRLVWDLEKLRLLLDLFEVRSNLIITDTSVIQETAQNFSENDGSVMFMTDFNKALNFSDKKKRIAVNMQYWEELVCKIDSTQLYVDALNTELQRPDKATHFEPESRYVDLLNRSLVEVVYQVAIRELQMRYTIAVMYSFFVGVWGVVPAFASIVSTYVFVDNFNEVAQQYKSYFQGSSPQTQLSTLEMITWHTLPFVTFFGQKYVRENFTHLVVLYNHLLKILGKYFVSSDLNIPDELIQMVEKEVKYYLSRNDWKVVSLREDKIEEM